MLTMLQLKQETEHWMKRLLLRVSYNINRKESKLFLLTKDNLPRLEERARTTIMRPSSQDGVPNVWRGRQPRKLKDALSFENVPYLKQGFTGSSWKFENF